MALVRLGALWRAKDKNSKAVASGPCGQTSRFVLLRNDKKGERDPDFILMIGDADKKPEGAKKSEKEDDIQF